MNNEKQSQCWSGPVPATADSLKFSRELWDYFNTMEAVSGLKSSLGAQLEILRCGGPVQASRNGNTGPEGRQLAAIDKYRKTWRKLCLLPGSVQETISRYYGGGKVSETEIASAHKAFRELL